MESCLWNLAWGPFLGTCSWDPLGTCSWEPCLGSSLGNLWEVAGHPGDYLEWTCSWEPCLITLLGNLAWEPISLESCLGTFVGNPLGTLLGNIAWELSLGALRGDPLGRLFGNLVWNLAWELCLRTPFLGTFGNLAWEPVLGPRAWEPLGICSWGTSSLRIFGNMFLGTLLWDALGTLLGNLFPGNLFPGNLAWKPVLGNLAWEPCSGTRSWEPVLGNLAWEPCSWEPGNFGNPDFGSSDLLRDLDYGWRHQAYSTLLGEKIDQSFIFNLIYGNLNADIIAFAASLFLMGITLLLCFLLEQCSSAKNDAGNSQVSWSSRGGHCPLLS